MIKFILNVFYCWGVAIIIENLVENTLQLYLVITNAFAFV